MPKFTPISVHDLGDYLREQRHSAQLSLRQLSAVAGISNPYLSQIERGLKKPSAEILQALAKALRISAESLYVRAGILEERTDLGDAPARRCHRRHPGRAQAERPTARSPAGRLRVLRRSVGTQKGSESLEAQRARRRRAQAQK